MTITAERKVNEHSKWGIDCARGIADSVEGIPPRTRKIALAFIARREDVSALAPDVLPTDRRDKSAIRAVLNDTVVVGEGIVATDPEFRQGVELGMKSISRAFGQVAIHARESVPAGVPLMPPIPLVVPILAEAVREELAAAA